MKKIFWILAGVLVLGLYSCDTDPENIGYQPEHKPDYAGIREYKKSDHELYFGWFAGWTGETSISAAGTLKSLPDSIDMVSIWGSSGSDDVLLKDLNEFREQTGTKVIACMFTPYLGRGITPEGEDEKAYWGWVDNDPETHEPAIRKYAAALAKHYLDWGYDGLDLDNEGESSSPTRVIIYSNSERFPILIDELGKYMGPMSGTDKLLCLDGYLTNGMPRDSAGRNMDKYFNYLIAQAYYNRGYSDLDNRYSTLVNHFTYTSREDIARKFIVTEDFERHATDGGPQFLQRDGSYTRSILGMAAWRPLGTDGEPIQKGGSGSYHIENDYSNSIMPYYWTRRSIQIQNPAK